MENRENRENREKREEEKNRTVHTVGRIGKKRRTGLSILLGGIECQHTGDLRGMLGGKVIRDIDMSY